MLISVVLKYNSLTFSCDTSAAFIQTSRKQRRSMEVKLQICFTTSPNYPSTTVSFLNTNKCFGEEKNSIISLHFDNRMFSFSLQKCYLSSQGQMLEECPRVKIYLFGVLYDIYKINHQLT